MNLRLIDCLEEQPKKSRWQTAGQTERLLMTLSAASQRDLSVFARAGEHLVISTLFRRTHPDGSGGVRAQAEGRFDGLAGYLRTLGGGSSRQFLIVHSKDKIQVRLRAPREAATLKGIPPSYALPPRAIDAFHLVGDGVATPVVRFLSDNLLLPLVRYRLEGDRTLQAKSA